VPGDLRVIATAGHVDHGKSALIVRLTGIEPDRFEEEKRRGLTIDLGYAWCTLPSGRNVGFVDVPGHERFIGNMLAGVGPVRLVLFVVAADEGWKPQSEEHLEILDVLGLSGGVVALTKRDLVDAETLDIAIAEIGEHTEGTALAGAPIVPVSSRTGEGVDDLRVAIDAMLAAAPAPEPARTRLFVDRVFTIKGAGTVVTGTLTGDCLAVGDESELFPTGTIARIRSLQTHKESEDRACPVSRVAANLVGAERQRLERGDVLGVPGSWRPTETIEAVLRPVRGLARPVTGRGAFKVYAGAAEADAKVRFLDATSLEPGARAFVRIRLSRPLVLDVFDRFVLREAGRRETVAGGTVLDVAPPRRPGADVAERLRARETASRDDLTALLVRERGALRVAEAAQLTGTSTGLPAIGAWLIDDDVSAEVRSSLTASLSAFHAERPLEEGAAAPVARAAVLAGLRAAGAPADPELAGAVIDHLAADGTVVVTDGSVRLPSHRVAMDAHSQDVDRLLSAVGGEHEATPPNLPELGRLGIGRDVIEAAARRELVVRVPPDLVFTPAFAARAESLLLAATDGITVSAFREALGTSRKYAVPLLEWFDARGVTRREGDVRVPRSGRGPDA
jgi:selenocysteine-specific elongation factor